MINYIFLDIDGVLNDENYLLECYEKNGGHPMHMNHVPFDPNALTNLMYLVQDIRKKGNTPKIILSSTWRLHDIDTEIVSARIAEYGLRLEGRTPYIHSNRGEEIKHFLESQDINENYSFVILDDDSFDIKNVYPDRLVLVNRIVGLLQCDIDQAKKILEKEVIV